jgi:hypothetical protein
MHFRHVLSCFCLVAYDAEEVKFQKQKAFVDYAYSLIRDDGILVCKGLHLLFV